jgi:hypothetical protein
MNNEIWLPIEKICELTNNKKETIRRKCKSGEYKSRFVADGKIKKYEILLSSIENTYQQKYEFNTNSAIREKSFEEYTNAPEWMKSKAKKYIELFDLTKDMTYQEKVDFLAGWSLEHPEKKVCYSSLAIAQRKYNEGGISALLSKQGRHRSGLSIIDKECFEYFKSIYLREGAPSVETSWAMTLGYAKKNNLDIVNAFPSSKTFIRMLRKELPEQSIYLARYGQSAWNKKYAQYVPRDYSMLKAGECWVSDHAQIDVAVKFNNAICFPWVTVFRDAKTSKWLGWFLHAESPNSDHIFQAFYYGVLRFGLPEDVYLDNGKDYRCKDFAGGRTKYIKVKHKKDGGSLIQDLGIHIHFALPYNAQTKPVERDFLKIKSYLSKSFVGYRGGKITERPEKLKNEIKNNQIMAYEDFKVVFDRFIEEYLNKKSSKGKVLQGKCPDELWAEEFTIQKSISKDALKLFCMRTTRNVSIGRNGVVDSQLKITYWAEWMITQKGRKVYIRRDINAYQEAWIFDATTEEYLGKANAMQSASFLANSDIQKAHYQKIIETKNKEKKILKSYIQTKFNPSNEELVDNLIESLDKKDFKSNVKVAKISNTKMDKVIKEEKSKNNAPAKYVTPLQPKKKLYLTEAEKRRDIAKKAI